MIRNISLSGHLHDSIAKADVERTSQMSNTEAILTETCVDAEGYSERKNGEYVDLDIAKAAMPSLGCRSWTALH